MEDKKQQWQLEQKEEVSRPKQTESKLDKTALADFILAKMPKEMVQLLEEGKDMESLIMQWENRMLKKENEALKSRLEKATEKPLKLAGEGGEGEKDPFAAAFMEAMNQYR